MAGAGRYGGPHWRRVVAVLANSDARTAYAQIVLGAVPGDAATGLKNQQLNGRRRDRAIENLLGSGLVERTAAGGLVAPEAIFRDLLAQQPRRQAPTGAARFLRLGRIERYPANSSDRRELLAWTVNDSIQPAST